MKFPEPLVEGRLIRRYKRFLADVRLPDGREVTAHCPNTGSMLGCQLTGYQHCRPEVKYGSERSRIDLLLSGHETEPDAWVEVKNVTLAENGQGFFPDAVTERGQKHLRELMAQVAGGDRAVLFFVVNHTGIETVRPADHIDARYGQLLREACDAGVEVLAYRAALGDGAGNPSGELTLTESVPVILEV